MILFRIRRYRHDITRRAYAAGVNSDYTVFELDITRLVGQRDFGFEREGGLKPVE